MNVIRYDSNDDPLSPSIIQKIKKKFKNHANDIGLVMSLTFLAIVIVVALTREGLI